MNPIRSFLACAAACLASCVALAQEAAPLRPLNAIPLADVSGRIDHLCADVKGRRIFVAALEKNTIEVVDVTSGKIVRTLDGFAKPQGVLFVPEVNKLFVASGKDGTVKALDGTTLEVTSIATVSLGADAIGYDAEAKELYVGSGGGDAGKVQGDLTVLEAASGRQVAALATDAHAGGSVAERRGGRMFVLVPEKGQVVVLDRKSRKELAKWIVPGIEKNVALDLDENNRRLFLGVRTPPSVVVLDTESGRVVASVPAVATVDGLSFDAATRRIYVTGGEGFLDVIQQLDADQYKRIARIPTGPVARTSLFIPEWRRLFVAVPKDKERGAELRVFEVVP